MPARRVKVRVCTESAGCVIAELTDELSPRTFEELVKSLPIESVGYRWGDELYFSTPVRVGEENPKEVVDRGAVAYWPPGRALCLFWGPTPASRGPGEIRPASPVNLLGKVLGNVEVLSRVRSGERVRVELARSA